MVRGQFGNMVLTEKQREYQRDGRKENIEKVRASRKKWKENNPEKVREYQKRYAQRNPNKIREMRNRWAENNPQKVKLSNQKYHQKPEIRAKEKEYQAEYHLENKETIGEYKKGYQKRYARIPKQKFNISMRDKTSRLFPITSQKCSCGNLAECHHHNSDPYQYDKFDFMCNPCHNTLHNNLRGNITNAK